MKKILLILFGLLFVSGAYSAQIANVEYVHKMIEQTWDITVPYNDALNSVKQIANMKYLLSAIDVANHMLNGSATTDYGNGEFATLQVADIDTVNTAVETLIIGDGTTERNYKFFITTTSNTTSFKFYLSAAGEFYVDWGDGTRNKITRTNTQELEYSHNYSTAGTYTIKIGGKATAYNTSSNIAAISFSNTRYGHYAFNIASIDGSLGAIFGTLTDGTQPRFYSIFSNATSMTGSIPANLFAGISGAPAEYMFANTFSGCRGLTGAIPAGLFGNLTGAPAEYMFVNTFSGCRGLTGAIPAGLFGNLTGAPAEYMFYGTFRDCSGLTGAIPENLFGNISGTAKNDMFHSTFYGCSGLTSIPENLFGNISGTAKTNMFYQTFYNCTSLTGPSARINGQYLYEIWPNALPAMVDNMYYNATKLSDYLYIPVTWGGLGATTNEYPSAPSDAVYDFYLTTTSDTDMFAMQISAAGEFYIDWGDSKTEWITKSDTTNMTFGHKYASKGVYNIRLGGQATAYNTGATTAAISFYVGPYSGSAWRVIQTKIASIDGSLGAIFGTLSSDTNNQPRFFQTFNHAYNMKGAIPENLFAGISGAPTRYMFARTFYYCSGLTGAIPAGLFAGISGAPAEGMFTYTFSGCSGLTGAIPDGLFAGISGAPATYMFDSTFNDCRKLTSIPENLFGNISGTAQNSMFYQTFYNCTSLTGPSARINGQYLYEIWPSATSSQVNNMYYNATKLSDYSSIPSAWK